MRLNILVGIFVSIFIFYANCTSITENEDNLNAAASKPLPKSACEKSKLQVACPKGQVINIVQANYGRVKNLDKCNPNKNKKFNTKCKSSKSLTVMKQNCHMKQSCAVDATNAVFGDPCPKTIKYLEIQYRCVPVKVTTKAPVIKKTTPKAITPKKVVTTKIPPKKVTPKPTKITKPNTKIPTKKVTPKPVTTAKPITKIPTKKVTSEPVTTAKPKLSTIKLTTKRPTPKLGTTMKVTTGRPTPKVGTTKKVTTEIPTPKVGTTMKVTTERTTPKVGTTLKVTTQTSTSQVFRETTVEQTTEKSKTHASTSGETTFREITTVENKPLSQHACEHGTLHVDCVVGKVIRIVHANYGRTSMEICPQNSAKHWNINCEYNKTTEITRKMCDGKTNCKVAASNSLFTDPCGGTLKYLEVTYLCEDETTTRPASTTKLDIGFPFTITRIPKITKEPPHSTTLKPLVKVELTTASIVAPVTTTEVPTSREPVITTSTTTTSEPTDNPTTATSQEPEPTSTLKQTLEPSTEKEIPTASTPKPQVTAPETTCKEDDLDCIIDDLGQKPKWFICDKDFGSYPHPSSNKLFIFCLNWKPLVKKCGQGRVFSEKFMTCVNP